jgi:hypothetical protein
MWIEPIFVEGETTDKNVPNASEHWTTKTFTMLQMTKRDQSGFKLAIQYTMVVKTTGRIKKLGIWLQKPIEI